MKKCECWLSLQQPQTHQSNSGTVFTAWAKNAPKKGVYMYDCQHCGRSIAVWHENQLPSKKAYPKDG
jgi:hypothetical protein